MLPSADVIRRLVPSADSIRSLHSKSLVGYNIKDRAGFSGTKKDKLGRKLCYESGDRVPCGSGKVSDRDSPKHEAPEITLGDSPQPTPSEQPINDRVARAKSSHKLIDKNIQRYCEEGNEIELAKKLGGVQDSDNKPFDIGVPTENGFSDGIELKTLVNNTNNKLTMDSYSQVRKAIWERDNDAVFHTVVVDDRQVFNALGKGQHDPSKRVYYYRRGIAGSARIETLYKCRNLNQLKKLMKIPEETLPTEAKRTDSHITGGEWTFIDDDEGKRFVDKISGRKVRAKS